MLGLTLSASAAWALSITGDSPPPSSNLNLQLLIIAATVALIWPTLGVAMLAAAAECLVWWAASVLRPETVDLGMLEPLGRDLIFKACTVQLLAALISPFLSGALLRAGWTRARAASLCAALSLGGFAAAGGWRLGGAAIVVVAAGLCAAAAVSACLASGKRTPQRPPRPDLSRAGLFTRLEDGAFAFAPLGILGQRCLVPAERKAELEARCKAIQRWSLALLVVFQAPWLIGLFTFGTAAAFVLFLLGAAATVPVCRRSVASSGRLTDGLEPLPWPDETLSDFMRWATLSTGMPLTFLAWCYAFSGMLSPARERLKQEGLSFSGLARDIGVRRGAVANLRRLAIGALLLWPMFWGGMMLWAFGIIGTAACLIVNSAALAFPIGVILESLLGLDACRRLKASPATRRSS